MRRSMRSIRKRSMRRSRRWSQLTCSGQSCLYLLLFGVFDQPVITNDVKIMILRMIISNLIKGIILNWKILSNNLLNQDADIDANFLVFIELFLQSRNGGSFEC